MLEFATSLPALGAAGQGHWHNYGWLILAIVVFAIVAPLAYFFGHHGGQAGR